MFNLFKSKNKNMKNSVKDNDLIEQIQSIRQERQARTRKRNRDNEAALRITNPDDRALALKAIRDEDTELTELSDKIQELKNQERQERRAS